MRILAVDNAHLPRVWVGILRFIQEPLAYEAGDLTPESIYKNISKGIFRLLVVYDETNDEYLAAQTLEVIDSPRGRWLNLPTTGGKDIDQWEAQLENAITTVAKEQGCLSICTRGRKGWLKRLAKYGYKPLYFIAQKNIGEPHVSL